MDEKKFGVKIQVEFSAAHHIRGYDGNCARPHGHNFKVDVEATTTSLNEIGLALDFRDLKKIVRSLSESLDHQDLNEMEPFRSDINPTAEEIARYFFDEINSKIRARSELSKVSLKKVTLWENDRSSASYGYL